MTKKGERGEKSKKISSFLSFFSFKTIDKLKNKWYNNIVNNIISIIMSRTSEIRKVSFLKKEGQVKKTKKEGALVTKESICTVCGVFCFLAFLMLCTGTLIFGEGGRFVQAFLTGLFGYLAYPFMLGGVYLSIMGLLDKRLVKNRKLGWCVALVLLCLALVVHSAFTYTWGKEDYLSRCFASGEDFPKTAPLGFLGGLLVLAFFTIFSKVGAIVAFSVFALVFVYFCYLLVKNPKEKKVKKEKVEGYIPVADIPVANVVEENKPFIPPVVEQRPGVSLNEQNGQGFSPFGVPAQNEQPSSTPNYQKDRELLFGGSPADNFRTNLLFDPNARVNQPRNPVREEVAPTQTTYTPAPSQTAYTPSYTSAFEDAVNAETEQSRPQKIVTDRVVESYEEKEWEAPAYSPVETPVEAPVVAVEERYTPPVESTPVAERQSVVEEPVREQEPPKEPEYRRHDYMDLFSPSNPNVFGNDEESARYGREFADRALENGREVTRDRGERDGYRLLDDEESVREAPFDRERTVEPELESRTRDEEIVDRSRDYEEALPARSFPQEPPKPVEPPKPEPPKPRVIKPYVRPRLDDFDCRDIEPTANEEEIRQTKENIIATLEEFKIFGASIASVSFGPTVTRYNVTIPRNIPPKKVVALNESIAISLLSSGVNMYPNYEDGVVSIEVPNKERQFVQLGCMLSGDTFVNSKPSALMFAMGKDVANRKVYGDVCKMVHLLVAGSTKSGKSVFLGSLIISLIYKYSPEELRLILIDPKKTEFVLYNNLPHLMINEIITDAGKAVQSLNWAIGEMNRRYSLFEAMSRSGKYVVNLDQYNEQLEKAQRLPKIVIIIDELADLMLAAKKDIEDKIQNLTQKARAAGIHLIVATQRPSTDVITGVIKSNLTTRIAFAVATDVDSRVILDQTGAQKLLGMGDLLYTMPGINTPVRVQSAFISNEESQRIVSFIKNNNEAYYDEEATAYINSRGGNGGEASDPLGDGDIDPMYIEALRFVIQTNSASISMIQRKCSAGYNRAGKIIEWMEDMGYISPFDGAKARKVLITKEEFESKYGPL